MIVQKATENNIHSNPPLSQDKPTPTTIVVGEALSREPTTIVVGEALSTRIASSVQVSGFRGEFELFAYYNK